MDSGIIPSSQVPEDSSSREVGQHDLLIVGNSVLSGFVAKIWKTDHPDCQIVEQPSKTMDTQKLIRMGINPYSEGTNLSENRKFPYVIFCVHMSRSPDYIDDLRQAQLSCCGNGGSFLFISNISVYDSNNFECDEDGPTWEFGSNPWTDVLLKSEKDVLSAGGCVLRLAGLYKADLGVHTNWLNSGIVNVHGNQIFNLIHYEDAASLAVAILEKKFQSQIFLGCDNHPVTSKDIINLISKSGKYAKRFEHVAGTDDNLVDMKLKNSKTRAELGWEPKYPSIAEGLDATFEAAPFPQRG